MIAYPSHVFANGGDSAPSVNTDALVEEATEPVSATARGPPMRSIMSSASLPSPLIVVATRPNVPVVGVYEFVPYCNTLLQPPPSTVCRQYTCVASDVSPSASGSTHLRESLAPEPDGNAIFKAWHHRADNACVEPSFEYAKRIDVPVRPSTDTVTGTLSALHSVHALPEVVLVFAGIVHENLLETPTTLSRVKEAHDCPLTVIASGAVCPTLPKLVPYTVNLIEAPPPVAGPIAGMIDVTIGASRSVLPHCSHELPTLC